MITLYRCRGSRQGCDEEHLSLTRLNESAWGLLDFFLSVDGYGLLMWWQGFVCGSVRGRWNEHQICMFRLPEYLVIETDFGGSEDVMSSRGKMLRFTCRQCMC